MDWYRVLCAGSSCGEYRDNGTVVFATVLALRVSVTLGEVLRGPHGAPRRTAVLPVGSEGYADAYAPCRWLEDTLPVPRTVHPFFDEVTG